jgi:sulfide:quinone oxidoreductase
MTRSKPTHVLIAGGGVAALEAALALRALAEERVSVELLAPEPHFWYRPLAVAEPFKLGEVQRFELQELAAAADALFTLGALASVDARRHVALTAAGCAIEYDSLLIACGTLPEPAIRGALTFRGPADTESFERLLAEIHAGEVRRVAFAVPWGAAWSLPLYELALLTAGELAAFDIRGVELALVTPEDEPLRLFGQAASEAVRGLLEERGIVVHTRSYPANFRDGALLLVPEGTVEADRVVALPRLRGQRIDGIPQTRGGFIPVDVHGRVSGVPDVFAAGDITSFPVNQGGIAAQQAEAAAEAIAAAAGAELAPRPFRPVLRGLLLTGSVPRYLRRELTGGFGESSSVSREPLWWPPAKIISRYLAPFLAELTAVELPHEVAQSGPGAVPVEVELEARDVERSTGRLFESLVEAAGDPARTVGDVMLAEPLVVAPEETLGEVAEKMRERDVGSALVADDDRLIGILTSRDLLRALASRVHSSEARVREWMTAEPLVVPAGATLPAAALLMTEHAVHRLPVVEGERPVGVVGLRDVVRSARSLRGIGLGF